MGESKFEFIVRRNLCDLQGKRILELGCNAGVVSRHMVRLGAKEVIGVDSHSTWPDWLEQAQFVTQVLEKRCDQKYNVKFIDMDLRDVPSADLGNFDAVIALNCLYYVEEENIEKIIRHVSSVSDRFLIQCNTVDQKHLGERPTPAYMKRALAENGFPVVKVDAPWDKPRQWIIPRRYHRPVVVGTKR